MRVAFLGLGAMGEPMAGHVASRHDLTVWNRTAGKAEDFARKHSCRVAPTPRQAAEGAEIVVTCLPSSREVEALLEGPDGLAAGLAPGAILLDCTSGSPAGSARIASRLQAQGVGFADCPVSGGVAGARAGNLMVMAGGDPAVIAQGEPVLRCFGRQVAHMGPVGAGCAMKAVNNMLLAVNMLAFSEGMTALARYGLEPARAVEVLNGASGRSQFSEKAVPDRVLSGTFRPGFRLALLAKDTDIAAELLRDTGVVAPFLLHAQAMLREIAQDAAPDADYLEIVKRAEQRAGVELRARQS